MIKTLLAAVVAAAFTVAVPVHTARADEKAGDHADKSKEKKGKDKKDKKEEGGKDEKAGGGAW